MCFATFALHAHYESYLSSPRKILWNNCFEFRLETMVVQNSFNEKHITGAPNDNFREKICSEGDLRSRIFGTFVVKFLACLPLLGFSNIQKMVKLPIFNGFLP